MEGVSHDLMTRSRSVEEAKRRGRWRSDASLKRYGKETRVLSELNKIRAVVLDYGVQVQAQLFHMLAGTLRLPPPLP